MTYQGSKAKYSKYICPIIQECINKNNVDTFLDPFVGGANIIKNIKCKNRIAADNNKYLIALWKELQKPDFQFPTFPSREDWDRCKNNEEKKEWYIGFVSIFSSNMTGGFPAGYDKTGTRYNGRINNCKKDIPLIKNINFIYSDYKDLISQYQNCVIYCDPPYKNTHKYDYKNFNHDDFWKFIRQASKNNYIFISEQEAPNDFLSIWSKDICYNIRGQLRTATEQLFIYQDGLINV